MEELTTQRDHVRAILSHFFEPAVVDRIMSLARPAVRLSREALGGTRLKGSRLGGLPAALDGPWPTWQDRVLDFLGVIDFAEIAEVIPVPGLPTRGAAGFFYATETPWAWGIDRSEADGWRVVPMRDGTASFPPSGAITFPEQLLHASPFLSLPCHLEPSLNSTAEFREVYEQIYRAWLRYIWPDDLPCHQLGGWPVLVQRPLWLDCAYASAGRDLGSPVARPSPEESAQAEQEWRLLLQLHTDEALGWRWGDEGAVYFVARRDDLAVGTLDRSWLTLQSR